MEQYPYFICPAVRELRENPNLTEEERHRLRRLIAANVGDTPSLRRILGIDPEEFAKFYPDMVAPDLSTNSAIDSFLANFGNPDAPTPRAAAEIPEATQDDTFATGAEIPEVKQDDIIVTPEIPEASQDDTTTAIDAFLATAPPPKRSTQAVEEIPQFSQEMANSCIKSHDYKQALQIIQHLVLNNPEKSIYFADQIRFLKKLILIQDRKN